MVNISGSRSLTRDWWGWFRRGPKKDKNRKRKSRSSDRLRATPGPARWKQRLRTSRPAEGRPCKSEIGAGRESAGNRRHVLPERDPKALARWYREHLGVTPVAGATRTLPESPWNPIPNPIRMG